METAYLVLLIATFVAIAAGSVVLLGKLFAGTSEPGNSAYRDR